MREYILKITMNTEDQSATGFTDDQALLAVIVISHGLRSTLPAAVRSVLEQDIPVELLVVHTGPGDVRGLLESHGLSVPVLVDPVSRYVGAARNLGIAHTIAPYVAFLADDCIAEPNWARARVQAHQQGALAVASALLPTPMQHPVSLAKFLINHYRRLPRTPEAVALRYGASYSRELLEKLGSFREDMPGAEDSHYNDQVSRITEIRWNPAVVTLHTEPTNVLVAFQDQYRRGIATSAMCRQFGTRENIHFLSRLFKQIRCALANAPAHIEPGSKRMYPFSIPFMILFIMAFEIGMHQEQAVYTRQAPC